ncbi:MAG: GDP-mannose 4,6-dehydratase [Betaproteobacteria bacterium]|nr:GDP-mannose 4,6-dehydratase [Betaproteobacteria bacterium]
MKLLITGAAGFIGSALAGRLLERGDTVVGIDNLNEYYDVNLKKARLERLSTREKFTFEKLDIADCLGVKALFARERFDALGACRTCDATSSLCKTGQPNEVENNITTFSAANREESACSCCD